jgi:hypothetical protein
MQTLSSASSRRALPALATTAAAVVALLAGCASGPAPTAPAATDSSPAKAAPAGTASAPAAAASAASAAAATRPVAGAPPPFAEVTRDARRSEGFLDIWTKDEKTWIEIPAARLNQPFFFANALTTGLGERFFWPGLPGSSAQVVYLRRVGNQVQLVAVNDHARAPEGTPLARAVTQSYSESLIASAPLAASPHPERKSLLVDASVLLGGDIPGTQTRLEATYRLPYALDRTNSSIERIHTDAKGTTLTLRSHFALARLPAPPVFAPGAPPPNPAALPNPPSNVPDARSLFLSFAYTLAPLPAQPMKARAADQRVGYFTESFIDFGNDSGGDRRTHLIRRWRLEKKDPAAAMSEPKEPIRVVMDRNIPEKWRPAIKRGILEWNKAFERAGWLNAVVVEQQPEGADWSALEGTRILAVRWFAIDGPGATAVGPSQSDPRSGEILRGAAIIPENWARFERSRVGDVRPPLPPVAAAGAEESCSYADEVLEDARFGYELLALRGDFDPEGPQAERFIAQALTDTTMHEVGHALGLRHNFRASAGMKPAQLRDEAWTASHGVSNSVMDYNALNLPLEGEPGSEYHMVTLGAYDYWAIEYGYREFPAATEKEDLARLAAQGDRDPALAYSTDEDLGSNDPLVNQRDLGDDPLAFAQRQIKLAHELWQRTQARTLAPDDDMTIYRRNLTRGLNFVAASVPMVTKYLGGTYTSRALAGAGQALVVPVPAAQQRAALDLLVGEVFAAGSFRFEPKFMSRLAVDQLDRTGPNRFIGSTDFSLPGAVLSIQRSALDALMSEGLATRLADAEAKVDDPRTLIGFADVQSRLSSAIWSELKVGKGGKGEIESLRRNLQREHLKRLAGSLLRPASGAAADVRAASRQTALQLQGELKAALAAGGWNATARAHLAESLETLDETLKAPLVKQGV